MEPNFVRRKVPELKKNLKVRGIGVENKRREGLLDLSTVVAHDLAIIHEQGDQMGISAKLVRDVGTIPDPYILAQIGLDLIH